MTPWLATALWATAGVLLAWLGTFIAWLIWLRSNPSLPVPQPPRQVRMGPVWTGQRHDAQVQSQGQGGRAQPVHPVAAMPPMPHMPSIPSIPRRIWTYWHSPELPLVVQRCIANWRKLNPDFQVTVLHAGNLAQYLDDVPAGLKNVGIPKQTDWIRLALLERHGGYWLDASLFLTRPLAWVEQLQQAQQVEFVGFYLDGYTTDAAFPVVESWFLAAPAQSRFIAEWRELFQNSAIDQDTQAYLQALRAEGSYERYTQKIGDPGYHTIHVTAQHLLQAAASASGELPYRLHLLCAEDSAYAYHAQSRWKRRRLYVRLLWNAQQPDAPALIKLRGGERRKLEPYLRKGLFRPGSLAARQLHASTPETKAGQ